MMVLHINQKEPTRLDTLRRVGRGILLEEGQRIAIVRALGISDDNEFRGLEHLGGEVVAL